MDNCICSFDGVCEYDLNVCRTLWVRTRNGGDVSNLYFHLPGNGIVCEYISYWGGIMTTDELIFNVVALAAVVFALILLTAAFA